jgi:hypothetical protein
VLHGDMRAPFHLSSFVLNRARLRRILSIVTLLLLDCAAVSFALAPKPYLPAVDHVRLGASSPLVWFLAIGVTLGTAAAAGLYGLRRRRRNHAGLFVWAFVTPAVLAVIFLAAGKAPVLPALLVCWVIGLSAAMGLRLLYDGAIAVTVGTDEDAERMLVVGDADAARRFMAALKDYDDQRSHRLVAVVSADRLQNLDTIIAREGPQVTMLLDTNCRSEQLETLLETLRRRGIRLQLPAERLGEEVICRLPGIARPVFAARPPIRAQARRRHRGGAHPLAGTLALLPRSRRAHQAQLPRAGVLRELARGRLREAVSLLQVPHHVRRRGGEAG